MTDNQPRALGMAGAAIDDRRMRELLRELGTIAMVGVSAKPVRPSHFVMKYLLGKGYRVIPVNPGLAGKELLGQKVHASLADIDEPVDTVDIFRGGDAAGDIVDEALALRPPPRLIWMQLGVANEAAAARARAAGLVVVMNRCPKIEFGRLSGEIGWAGVNSRRLSSKRPMIAAGFQRRRLDDNG